MLHHMSLPVSDLERSAAFYDAALGALGYSRVSTYDNFIGYGLEPGKDKFAITEVKDFERSPGTGFHLAFAARGHSNVDGFHAAALTSGGLDNGKSGMRPNYGPDYYAAFVFDPDGYLIEAVINEPA